jgi:FG-GAP-like repeat
MLKSSLAVALTLAATLPALAQQLPPYKAGFPLTLAGQGGVRGKPALADLKIPGDAAGVKSIIFGTYNGNLHVIHRTSATTWAEAPGFPVAVGAPILSSPAVGDLDSDGVPEIVIGYGDPFVGPSLTGGVRAFRNSGATLWNRPSGDRLNGAPDGRPDPVPGTPAIGDVDGDGQNDVVWGSTDYKVYFVSGPTGANKPNWPRDVLDTVVSSPVLHDMDGDGRAEIIIGVDAHVDGTFGTPDGGCVHVIPGAQPVIPANPFPANVGYPQDLAGFPKCVDQVIQTDPVVGDIDGDGRPDIVHGTGNFYPGRTKAAYAWKCDGTSVSGWPVALSGQTQLGSSLALANLDGDAALEVVLAVDTTSQVYAIKGNGSVLPGFPKAPKSFFGTSSNAGSPLVADVLNDTALEILVPTNTEITAFSTTGTQLTEDGPPLNGDPSFYTPTTLSNSAVGDLDPGDAKIEVIAISTSGADTVVHVWNPISRAPTPPWGQYRQNEKRAGVAPGTGPCRIYGTCPAPPSSPQFNTIAPCRVVDTRGTAGVPIGGPALASGGLRDFVLRGKCNVPTTAKALSLNVTVVGPSNDGFVRFSPSCQLPTASTINFRPGQTRANNAVLQLGNSDGVLTANAFITGGGTVHLLIDVNGYFQ